MKKIKYYIECNNLIFWFKLTKDEAQKFGLSHGMNSGNKELIEKLKEYEQRKEGS